MRQAWKRRTLPRIFHSETAFRRGRLLRVQRVSEDGCASSRHLHSSWPRLSEYEVMGVRRFHQVAALADRAAQQQRLSVTSRISSSSIAAKIRWVAFTRVRFWQSHSVVPGLA